MADVFVRTARSLKQAAQHELLKIFGNYRHFTIDKPVEMTWCGTVYGGFFAYLDGLGPDAIVYSFGIGEDSSFDEAIIAKCGCTVHGFDPTPKAIAWVQSRPDLPAQFRFHPYGIGAETGTATFYLPRNPDFVSGSLVGQQAVDQTNAISVEIKSLGDIARDLGHARIDILKMDIEGAEYAVFDDILASGPAIGQILVEFHDRLFAEGAEKSRRAVAALRAHGYGLVAISPNFQEASFIRL